jgi:hypothetical protein
MRRSVPVPIEIALLIGGLTALSIAATYPLVRHLTTHLPNDLTDPVLVAWILAWDAHALPHGIAALFNAPSFYPYAQTLAYSETMIGVALFTAPLQWLSANPILVYNLAFIASFVQAGAGMYILARSLTGRGDAALLAALAYAFAPMRAAQFAHLQWLMTGWLPLSLWGLHRYFSTGRLRFLLASAGAYVLQSLTGSYFTYFSLLPSAAVAAMEIWQHRPPLRRTLGHTVIAGAVCAVSLAPLAYRYYHAQKEHDFRRPVFEIVSLSADLSDYLHAHKNVRLWRSGSWANGEHELFPGAIVIALAVASLFAARGSSTPRIRLYAALAAATIVLSLGPQPSAWGHHAPIPGPYQLLLATVPGLDGLRALSRIAVVVLLALSVLAAFGAIRLLDRVTPRFRIAAATALAMGIVAEGWAAPIRTARFDPLASPDDRAAYTFLRDAGPDGAAIELPMSLENEEREQRYQYLTVVHGHRIVNGRSGNLPALTQWLYNPEQSPLADASRPAVAIEFLRAIGVRYVIVHADEQPPIDAALMRELRTLHGQVAAAHEFGRTAVFTLADDVVEAAPAGAHPIPLSSFRARSSHSQQRLPLLFDNDRDTRWLTGTNQTGDEWIELEFDAPRNVARVRMQTAERSFGDYPRELAIDAIEAAGPRTLFRGSVIPQFGRGVIADDSHTYPNIDVLLPDNHAKAIRLRQLGHTSQLFWSIHELQVWER